MSRPLIRAALAALLVLPFAASVALGHAELESAAPGPNDEVVGSRSELVAQFSQNLDASRTSLEVRDAAGTRVARGGEPGDGPREFRLALPELEPGTYEVRWTSFSKEDGELARGSYKFTVAAAPSPTPSPTAPPSKAPTEPPTPAPSAIATPAPTVAPAPGGDAGTAGDSGALLIPILASLLVVGGLGAWLLRRRPR